MGGKNMENPHPLYSDFWKNSKEHRIQIWKAIHEDNPDLLPECITSHIYWWRRAKMIMWRGEKDPYEWRSLLRQASLGKQGPNGGRCPNIVGFALERFEFTNEELSDAGLPVEE